MLSTIIAEYGFCSHFSFMKSVIAFILASVESCEFSVTLETRVRNSSPLSDVAYVCQKVVSFNFRFIKFTKNLQTKSLQKKSIMLI